MIPLHLLARFSPAKLVFLTPLYFGIAHIHHFYEFKIKHPNTPLLRALLRPLFQFAYTSIFGWFAAFVFLRTASIVAIVVVHMFCNSMGFPRLWGRVEAGELEPPASRERGSIATGELNIAWTIAYYVLLFAGAGLFYQNIWTLTESTNGLVSFK